MYNRKCYCTFSIQKFFVLKTKKQNTLARGRANVKSGPQPKIIVSKLR